MTKVNIMKIGEVEGRDGPQWELQVQWPWTIGDYTDKVWLDQSVHDKPALGSQPVALTRRGLKRKREGGNHDGSRDWMWNWTINEFGTDAPTPPNPLEGARQSDELYETPSPAARPQQTASQAVGGASGWPAVEGIVRGHVENIAVRLYGMFLNNAEVGMSPDLEAIRQLRDRVYHELTMQPIAPFGYCYGHGIVCQQGHTGAWGHKVGDDWCIDGQLIEPQEEPEDEGNI